MPLITLATDIGQQDYIVGAFKGQLHAEISQLSIADISHYLPLDNFAHAAYICSNAYKYYPSNTLHILLINVFDEPETHFVICNYNNQFILCPNNGILSMLVKTLPENTTVLPIINATNIMQITKIIATTASTILANNTIEGIGTKGLKIVEKAMMKPTVGNDWIDGHILFIDNFNNVIVNITEEVFENARKGRNYKIVFKRNEVVKNLSTNYASVKETEQLAWFNAAGHLELAINKGFAAELFGLESYKEKMHQEGKSVQNKWFYQTVRIYFE
ncbi:MAG TPA: SAM-dependent chlorinase/fluorinase [Chitinophagaceae bacterium]|nr:SAM-dependent chlorinase/fluorinase [Chitinophagaceae bacterium]HNF28649.1 SAM-dependent chlorinase/fluorinase [Chitinophagaceae bacterium]HNN31135.1 SAM-dependent chlorinase/fluorinase [Chitinophagaceae bacterium]